MDDRRVDTVVRSLTRHRSRRGLVSSLPGGGLALLAARLGRPEIGAAKKKKGTDCKKKEQQRCNQDTALCKALVTPCLIQPEVCAAYLTCCETCSAHGFISCAQAALMG